jgi:hypothetical protein
MSNVYQLKNEGTSEVLDSIHESHEDRLMTELIVENALLRKQAVKLARQVVALRKQCLLINH